MKDLITHAREAVDLFYFNKDGAIKHLAEILRVTYIETYKLKKIERQHSGILGRAYIHLLDVIDDSKYFQTLSTLGYYFSSKGVEYNPADIVALEGRIIGLNLGARSFYRTIANALNMQFANYIDFSNLQALPTYVRYVLMLEYWSLTLLEKYIPFLPNDMQMRKSWLDDTVHSGYFNSVCNGLEEDQVIMDNKNNLLKNIQNLMVGKKRSLRTPVTIENQAVLIHEKIMIYIESKIFDDNIDFNINESQGNQYGCCSDPNEPIF